MWRICKQITLALLTLIFGLFISACYGAGYMRRPARPVEELQQSQRPLLPEQQKQSPPKRRKPVTIDVQP